MPALGYQMCPLCGMLWFGYEVLPGKAQRLRVWFLIQRWGLGGSDWIKWSLTSSMMDPLWIQNLNVLFGRLCSCRRWSLLGHCSYVLERCTLP
jgi:hypothetical protein